MTDELLDEEELPQTEASYDAVEIAREVLAGRWGRGNRRKIRLIEAGYDPDLIAFHVNNILHPAP